MQASSQSLEYGIEKERDPGLKLALGQLLMSSDGQYLKYMYLKYYLKYI